MPVNRKSALYTLLKQTGAPLTTSYMKYLTKDLEAELRALGVDIEASLGTEPMPEELPPVIFPEDDHVDLPPPVQGTAPRRAKADPEELPGQRINSKLPDDVIRIDDEGRHWLQEEVRKPAYPKPRGRRVLKYIDTGVTTETIQSGEYVETFEVAGQEVARPAEVKITLPSYQVGIYRDPRFPFKIYCYNGMEGFSLFDVHDFYGGAELVPAECKRIYIENELCYDIRSVVRAIQAEHRQLQLAGRIK